MCCYMCANVYLDATLSSLLSNKSTSNIVMFYLVYKVLCFWENLPQTPGLNMLEMSQFTTFPPIQQVAVMLVALKCLE